MPCLWTLGAFFKKERNPLAWRWGMVKMTVFYFGAEWLEMGLYREMGWCGIHRSKKKWGYSGTKDRV